MKSRTIWGVMLAAALSAAEDDDGRGARGAPDVVEDVHRRAGRPSHAYLLHGPAGSGKREVARR